jgi:8-hydroxy-5-deazaflavin:NADPH oxidoreductase
MDALPIGTDVVRGLTNITVVGRGRVGGGIARLWAESGHNVIGIGRDATGADVIVVAVPSAAIADALARGSGLSGQVTVEACNIYTARGTEFPSLAHQIKSIIGGSDGQIVLNELRRSI